MARKILQETGYTFVPSTRTVVLPRYIGQERLVLITNVTKNKVIYNFSDASLLSTSYSSYTDLQLVAYATGMSVASAVVGTITTVVCNNSFLPGQTVSITGTIPNAFNITGVIATATPTQFTIAQTAAGYLTAGTTWISGGTITAAANTVIVLNYNTSAMSSTDKLQITIDEYSEKFTPDQTVLDPTNKLRTSSPQALIDTDFEYGTQVSKWENLTMINNRPYAFQNPYSISNITDITMSANSRTVTVLTSTPPAVGTPVSVLDTYLGIANGNFIVETVSSGTNFTYTARSANNTTYTSIFDPNKTVIYTGTQYTNAQIGAAPTVSYVAGTNALTVTTTIPHGLAIGNEVAITGITGATGTNPNGSFVVSTITNPTTFIVYPSAAITGGTLVATSAAVFVRPQGSFNHRAFDGGVLFSSNGASNFEQAIRQTRRYFRYQSGKGIQMSSGTILKPYANLDVISSSGTTVTVQTKEKHNLQPGATVVVAGANESAYNGTFVVSSVIGWNQFTYTALSTPAATVASGNYTVSVAQWYGAANRLGIFDQQNGLFFEFDGTTIYAVRRNSTFQISGKVNVTNGSNIITQTSPSFPTYFSKQLVPGDNIVLRGQSYRVTDIAADSVLTISPAYRGTTATNVILSRTVDTKIPQSQWNLDKMDGTGPSGYNLDLSKMQMFYVDYTWYGAGFVRWGLRGPSGDVTYVHKMPNNNVNTEAYMRSGNLPGRYETVTTPPTTFITASIGASDTSITVSDTSKFPSSGTLAIRGNTTTSIAVSGITASGSVVTYATSNTTGLSAGQVVNITGATNTAFNGTYTIASVSANTNFTVNSTATGSTSTATAILVAVEYINYTGTTSTSFTGMTRGQAGNTSLTTTIASGSNIATVSSGATAGLQIGQRVIASTIPDGTYITAINAVANTFTMSQSATASTSTVVVPPMGNTTGSNGANTTTGQAFAYSSTAPIAVEFAYPTFAPSISHWGTSVIMDGRFDSDKSLLFTYGQTTPTGLGAAGTTVLTGATGNSGQAVITVSSTANVVVGQTVTVTGGSGALTGGSVVTQINSTTTFTINQNIATTLTAATLSFTGANTKALLSIRCAPSVDNGTPAAFGARELVNRMQLTLATLDISVLNSTTSNLLVLAYLNGVPSAATTWTNAVGGTANVPNSSLAQIADYATNGNVTYSGGEKTGGFFVAGTGTSDLSPLRDLGNSILGGGTTAANTGIYPDGPDVLTIVVQNLASSAAQVYGRVSWTEAQA
jgi:hypothetical protein